MGVPTIDYERLGRCVLQPGQVALAVKVSDAIAARMACTFYITRWQC